MCEDYIHKLAGKDWKLREVGSDERNFLSTLPTLPAMLPSFASIF